MKSRMALLVLLLTAGLYRPAAADVQIGVGIALPGIRVGINVPSYPDLAPVPGYPVYYAPNLAMNLFFYDGEYWAFSDDNWYSSAWYDGPWNMVEPDYVPYYLLRVPVGYYRRPPAFFRGWNRGGPPRWDQRWGNNWRDRHQGWDRWNHSAEPGRAPLPAYQRRYSGSHYPAPGEQRTLKNRYYRYQPRGPQPQRPGAQPGHPQRPGAQHAAARRQAPMVRTPPGRPQAQMQRQQAQKRLVQQRQQQAQQRQAQQRQVQQRQVQQRQVQQRQVQQRQQQAQRRQVQQRQVQQRQQQAQRRQVQQRQVQQRQVQQRQMQQRQMQQRPVQQRQMQQRQQQAPQHQAPRAQGHARPGPAGHGGSKKPNNGGHPPGDR